MLTYADVCDRAKAAIDGPMAPSTTANSKTASAMATAFKCGQCLAGVASCSMRASGSLTNAQAGMHADVC
jgi:hypothetical protein